MFKWLFELTPVWVVSAKLQLTPPLNFFFIFDRTRLRFFHPIFNLDLTSQTQKKVKRSHGSFLRKMIFFFCLSPLNDSRKLSEIYRVSSRSVFLISLATCILEDWNIFHLKGDIHSFVSSTSSFLCDIGEPRYEQNKVGYQISRIRNTVLLQRWQKNNLQKKVIFGPKKKLFYVIFFFSCLKMEFCELMLSELGDLLFSLLRNSFNVARSIFSCKYFSKIAQYFQFF